MIDSRANRRRDDIKRREVNEFDESNPCAYDEQEFEIRKKEYLLFELERIKKEIQEIGIEEQRNKEKYHEEQMRKAMEGPRLQNNIPPGSMPVTTDVTLPDELFDFVKVLQQAADSGHHEKDNWLKPDGRKCSRKDMYASIFRHVAEAYCGSTHDKDSDLHPALHAMIRLGMVYVRWCKGLVHPNDIKE